MVVITHKCPGCRMRPWKSVDQFGDVIIGHCRWFAKYPAETQARASWNQMAFRAWNARIAEATDGISGD